MQSTLRWGRAALATVLALTAGTAQLAERIPLPSTDYRTKASLGDGAYMVSRHSKGKMRIEMFLPGAGTPIVSYLDLKTMKGLTVMPQPDGAPVGVETEFSADDGLGVVVARGDRAGRATVRGEACDLWRIEATAPEMKDANPVGCITHDGIPLRMEATVDGRREIAFEVTELERAPQDPKHFVRPTGLKIMRMPAGMPPMQK